MSPIDERMEETLVYHPRSAFAGHLIRFCCGEVRGTAYDEHGSRTIADVSKPLSPLFSHNWDLHA